MSEINSLVVQTVEKNLSVEALKASFSDFHSKAGVWKKLAEELVVNDESQTKEMAQAKEGRLALKKLRTSADVMRKNLKAGALSYGNAIQAAYNEVEATIKPIELILEQKEKYGEIKAAERFTALKEKRESELAPYIRFVPSFVNAALLNDEDYASVLNGAILQKKAEELRLEEEYKAFLLQQAEQAEAERLASEEREKLRFQMAKLKEEQEKKDRLAKEHNARVEADYRAAQVKAAAEAKAAADKAAEAAAEIQRQLESERAERHRIEREASEKAAAELRRIEMEEREKAEAERKAANAPEKSKLIALAILIDNIEIPNLETRDAMQIGLDVKTLLKKTSAFIREKSEKL